MHCCYSDSHPDTLHRINSYNNKSVCCTTYSATEQSPYRLYMALYSFCILLLIRWFWILGKPENCTIIWQHLQCGVDFFADLPDVALDDVAVVEMAVPDGVVTPRCKIITGDTVCEGDCCDEKTLCCDCFCCSITGPTYIGLNGGTIWVVICGDAIAEVKVVWAAAAAAACCPLKPYSGFWPWPFQWPFCDLYPVCWFHWPLLL